MFTPAEAAFISLSVEGFLYGLYSGIFIMYLQYYTSKNSRTTTIPFYALCLLYVLSTVSVVADLVAAILELRISSLSLQLQFKSEPILLRVTTIQLVASGCCDFLAQSILIYRCWIVWGQNILVVIVPSFLAIAYLAIWLLAAIGGNSSVKGQLPATTWGITLTITSFVISIAVNPLVTGLIVYRILKASTSVERSLGSTRGTKFRHVIFIIIESGMVLFAIQLVRLILYIVPAASVPQLYINYIVIINEMFNGITPTIILVRVSMSLSFDDKESFKEAVGSLRFNNPPSDPNTSQQMGSSGSIILPPQDSAERNEDMFLNNPTSDLPSSTLRVRQMGSSTSSSIYESPRRERSEIY